MFPPPPQLLDRYLKSEQVRFQQLFDSYDRNRSGDLDTTELRRMIKEFMPRATEPQLRCGCVHLVGGKGANG